MSRVAALGVLTLLGCFAMAAATGDRVPEQKVDAIFASFDKNSGSPGCAVGVIRDGAFVYKRGYGMASIELQVPLSPESVFYMGSVSKQFTAASVVLAAEQGLFSLDDDLRKWIPEIPFYGHKITLRQMLHHTSGLRDELALMSLAGEPVEDIYTTAEIIDLIARQKKLNFTPGDKYQYSNSNFFLLAQVVHRASGMLFSRFAQENIFRPLGMTHTRFYDDRTLVLPGRVAGYSPRAGGGFSVDWSTNFAKVGDGGLMSSVDDLLPWDRNFYHNKLGKGTLLKELETRGVLNSGKTITYALGLEISEYRGLPTVAHGGALFGYRTEFLRFPNQNFSVICLCNVSNGDPGAKAYRVADLYLAGQFTAPVKPERPQAADVDHVEQVKMSVAEMASYTGTYYSDELRATYRIALAKGRLMLNIAQDESTELQPGSRERFEAQLPGEFPTPIEFHFERDGGTVTSFTLSIGGPDGIHDIEFKRK